MTARNRFAILVAVLTVSAGISWSDAMGQTPPWKNKVSRRAQKTTTTTTAKKQGTGQKQSGNSTKPSGMKLRRLNSTSNNASQFQNTMRRKSGSAGSATASFAQPSGFATAQSTQKKRIQMAGQSAIQKRLNGQQRSGDADPTPPSKFMKAQGRFPTQFSQKAQSGFSSQMMSSQSRNILNSQNMTAEKARQAIGQSKAPFLQNGLNSAGFAGAGKMGRQGSIDRLNQMMNQNPQGHFGTSRTNQSAMDQVKSRLPGLPGMDSRMPNLFDGSNSRIPSMFGKTSGGQPGGSQAADPFGSQLQQYMAAKGNRTSWAMDGDDDDVTSQQIGAIRDTAIGAVAGGAGARTAVGNGAGAVGGIAWGIATANTSSPEQKKYEVDSYKGLVRQGRTGHLNENAREMDPEAKAEPSPLEQRWNSLKEKYFGNKDKEQNGDDTSGNSDSGTDNTGSDNDSDSDSNSGDNGNGNGDSEKEDKGFFQKVVGKLFGGDDEDEDGQPLPDGVGVEGADATEAEKAAALERIQTETKAGLVNPGPDGGAVKPNPEDLEKPAPGSNPRQGWAINPGPGQGTQQPAVDPSVIERLRNSFVDPPKPGLGGTPVGGNNIGPAPAGQGPVGGQGGQSQ